MSWLSKHEAIVNEAQPEDDDMLIFTTAEGRLMARVIRELVAYIIHESDTLSPDAKEVIEEIRCK